MFVINLILVLNIKAVMRWWGTMVMLTLAQGRLRIMDYHCVCTDRSMDHIKYQESYFLFSIYFDIMFHK